MLWLSASCGEPAGPASSASATAPDLPTTLRLCLPTSGSLDELMSVFEVPRADGNGFDLPIGVMTVTRDTLNESVIVGFEPNASRDALVQKVRAAFPEIIVKEDGEGCRT
jgi:hypothetical protein